MELRKKTILGTIIRKSLYAVAFVFYLITGLPKLVAEIACLIAPLVVHFICSWGLPILAGYFLAKAEIHWVILLLSFRLLYAAIIKKQTQLQTQKAYDLHVGTIPVMGIPNISYADEMKERRDIQKRGTGVDDGTIYETEAVFPFKNGNIVLLQNTKYSQGTRGSKRVFWTSDDVPKKVKFEKKKRGKLQYLDIVQVT